MEEEEREREEEKEPRGWLKKVMEKEWLECGEVVEKCEELLLGEVNEEHPGTGASTADEV